MFNLLALASGQLEHFQVSGLLKLLARHPVGWNIFRIWVFDYDPMRRSSDTHELFSQICQVVQIYTLYVLKPVTLVMT